MGPAPKNYVDARNVKKSNNVKFDSNVKLSTTQLTQDDLELNK